MQRFPATPGDLLGPMYFVRKPPDRGSDMCFNPETGQKAEGQVIYLFGRVLDTMGNPIQSASVEIWQANAVGRYNHPVDANPAPIDPNFDGWCQLHTDKLGAWYCKTIKPGNYPADETRGWVRPPHIHFLVTTSYCQLCTQMYFPDEMELNAKDDIFRLHKEGGQGELVLARPGFFPSIAREAGSLCYEFRMYLPVPVQD